MKTAAPAILYSAAAAAALDFGHTPGRLTPRPRMTGGLTRPTHTCAASKAVARSSLTG
eukprot:CAMPEP_0206045548 /NCGR_PEP_ID=MMETSP1466-20131121/16203_1 /ASSEMBLY_ACC=CAM_ASM_001126 /TAXON_ID=44452 /ORGANISM="Pavlova gyrans, Strain CCMP608" /LENGTH=57 /DNA_ID=CAMNT_0053420489 /DNA_START=28 /DNA_END=198 /DNA_ORIENTATION=-